MNWKNRRIRMPGRFDPARWEVTAGIGTREIVLLSAAVTQAVWLIFLNDAWPFVLRLVVAVTVGLVLLGVAMVPIKDKPIEYHVLKFLHYKLRPPGRVYRTAQKGALVIPQPETMPTPAPAPMPPATHMPRPVRPAARAGGWHIPAWMQPDVGLVLAAFVCVLIAGSVVAYVGHGGSLTPVQALITRVEAAWSIDMTWGTR